MKKTELIKKASMAIGKAGLKLKKHSPQILVIAGVVGTVASTVVACKATTKIDEVLGGAKEKLDTIHESVKKGYVVGSNEKKEYSAENSKKDLTIIYTQTALKTLKLYAPALILATLSVTSILAGNNILRKRNVAIAAAYAAVDRSFKEYRSRVVNRFGEQVDHELRNNIQTEKVIETVVDEEGNEQVVEKTVVTSSSDDEFVRIFDERSLAFDREYNDANHMFLRAQQSYSNDLLRANGYLFLNDVFDKLGFPRTSAGQLLGWVYKPDDPKYKGDNFVDFGIKEIGKPDDSTPSPIALEFNVDGVVYDLI